MWAVQNWGDFWSGFVAALIGLVALTMIQDRYKGDKP